jgi:hypothetical protein
VFKHNSSKNGLSIQASKDGGAQRVAAMRALLAGVAACLRDNTRRSRSPATYQEEQQQQHVGLSVDWHE